MGGHGGGRRNFWKGSLLSLEKMRVKWFFLSFASFGIFGLRKYVCSSRSSKLLRIKNANKCLRRMRGD